jgi:hypothetical protein
MPSSSYRFARRSFLRGVGGAFGLRAMLGGLEAIAAGAKPPPRLLVAFWPLGTVRPDFVPAAGADWTTAPILKPIADAGLANDTSVFFGFSNNGLAAVGGGASDAGTIFTMTGIDAIGTRAGEVEGDDACAGGPSFDQIFLRDAPALQRPGVGYASSICDSRVDYLEIAPRCLSYSTETQAVETLRSGTQLEHVPLLPVLRPLDQYLRLFSGFIPGGPTPGNQDRLLRALRERKSVLDLSLRQLARLRALAPGAESAKLDIHADAIRQVEVQLSAQIAAAATAPPPPPACTVPPAPPDVSGKGDDGMYHNDYNNPRAAAPDDPTHATVGQLHMDVLRAAFLCDIIRVATFQWSPGTNHVAFQNMYPGEVGTSYMHNPLAHRINSQDTLVPPATRRPEATFLSNVHAWYNARMASMLAGWKSTVDAYGGNLLDQTVIPFVTDVMTTGAAWSPMPALLFGGKALGVQNGKFWSFSPVRPLNDLWITIAQAFGLSVDAAPLNQEAFAVRAYRTGVISGLWSPPPP